VAHAEGDESVQRKHGELAETEGGWEGIIAAAGVSCKDDCDSAGKGFPDWAGGTVGQPSPITELEQSSGREIERDFRGVAHGVSRRVDRIKGLGNAIVPQVAAEIMRCMMQVDFLPNKRDDRHLPAGAAGVSKEEMQ
jgi:hypothetical protein